MKIVFTIDSFLQGGTEQSIAEMIPFFSKDTEVVVVYFYPKHDLLPVFQATGCRIHFLDLKGKYDWRRGIGLLRSFLEKERPDVVVSSLYRANIISRIVCCLLRIPLVGTFVEDSYAADRKQTFRGITRIKYYFTFLLDRLTAFIPSLWIANSEAIKKSNGKKLGVPDNRIRVVYRGRQPEEFPEWRPLPIHPVFRFATIGRLFEKKGYPELLEAFFLLQQEYPATELLVYGEGPFRREMEQQIHKLGLEGKIIIKGKVPNAKSRLYEAHCFVFPSRFEGFSGALVEAMFTGIPIVASNIPMNLEAITDGKTGLIHQVRDARHLYSIMKQVITHYNQSIVMGENARSVALKRYDLRQIAEEYETVLRRVADPIIEEGSRSGV